MWESLLGVAAPVFGWVREDWLSRRADRVMDQHLQDLNQADILGALGLPVRREALIDRSRGRAVNAVADSVEFGPKGSLRRYYLWTYALLLLAAGLLACHFGGWGVVPFCLAIVILVAVAALLVWRLIRLTIWRRSPSELLLRRHLEARLDQALAARRAQKGGYPNYFVPQRELQAAAGLVPVFEKRPIE